MIVSRDEILVSTVLGSCVSVCLFTRERTAGGIIHFSLPSAGQIIPDVDALKYGDLAIPMLVEKLRRVSGLGTDHFEAKIVGGAMELHGQKAPYPIGAENIEMARRVLAEYRIPIIGERVGGRAGQKVHFYSPSGRLQVAKVGA